MWKWLHPWNRRAPLADDPSPVSHPANSKSSPEDSAAKQAVHPAKEEQPVLIRGELWKNTGTERGPTPADDPQPALAVADLVDRLSQRDADLRRCTCEVLGQLGAKARDAIPGLLVAACDIDQGVRQAALRVLDQIESDWPRSDLVPLALPAVTKELTSSFTAVTDAAAALLTRIGPSAVPQLIEVLAATPNDIRRVVAVRVLAQYGPEAADAVPQLLASLVSEHSFVRESAAGALAAIGTAAEPAIPALIALLADRHPEVRQAAARALARVGQVPPLAVAALVQLLADRDDKVREAAVDALADVGISALPALTELMKMLSSEELAAWHENVQRAAEEYAAASDVLAQGGTIRLSYGTNNPGIDAIRRAPLKAMRNASWVFRHAVDDHRRLETTREAATRVLGELKPASHDVVILLKQALVDKNSKVRTSAARSLGQIGSLATSARPALVAALADDNEPVRKAASVALERIDPEWDLRVDIGPSVETIVEKLRAHGEAGRVAADALVAIGRAAVEKLSKALTDRDRVVRESAAVCLGRLGPKAEEARAALEALLDDEHGWVKKAAEQALRKIGAG